MKKIAPGPPREIYASGGGLLVTPINTPHLFLIVTETFPKKLTLSLAYPGFFIGRGVRGDDEVRPEVTKFEA